MSKKLAAKASLIQVPPPAPPEVTAGIANRAETVEARAKTAPGSMAIFMASQSAAVKEAEDLRQKLKAFDGALPVRRLDPQTVRPSRWANRHEHSFSDEAFRELKADIAAAGINVQPVVVRSIDSADRNAADGASPALELVFGHRRHRACLELGLPLQAMVVEMNDQQLFEAMERENRARKNLSAWEQGMMYRRALDEGLYPSQRRLAEALGVDISLVSKSLSLARLPDAVVRAFSSPLEIQFRWAQPLADALQKDPDGVLARALKLRAREPAPSSAEVLVALVFGDRGAGLNRSTPTSRTIEGDNGRKAVLSRDARGHINVKFSVGALSEKDEASLVAMIEKVLGRAHRGG